MIGFSPAYINEQSLDDQYNFDFNKREWFDGQDPTEWIRNTDFEFFLLIISYLCPIRRGTTTGVKMVDAVFPSKFSTGYFEFFRRSEQRTKIEIEKFTSKLDFNFIRKKIKFLDSNYMIERFLWILITGLLVEPLSFSSCHSFGVRVNFS